MATIIEMPKLSDTMTEGTLVKWVVKEGDTVSVGDILAEIETDKATMEMEAFDEGIVGKIYVQEGDKAPLGAHLAVLVEEGEEVPSSPPTEAAAPADADSGEGSGDTAADPAAPAATPAPASTTSTPDGRRIKASPLARKIAAEKGIDLATVQGTGPGGRIVRADVLDAKPTPAAGGSAPRPAPTTKAPPPSGEDQRIALSGMRRVIAERLLESKTTIPHFYLNIEVDAAPMMAFRKQVNEASEKQEDGNKYTVNDFIMKATVGAAAAVPAVNASFDGDAVIQYADVHLAVAVAVDEGLVTPVIRQAQKRSLLDLSIEMKDLAYRARNKKLGPDEMQGGTLTISNLGSYGIDSFYAVINPPQSLILAIGNIVKKPVVNEAGDIVPGLRLNIGLSGDHRVVDGAVGAEYLAEFRRLIENPALMLL